MKRILVLLTVVALMVAMLAPSALAAHPYWYTHNTDTGADSWSRWRKDCIERVSADPSWTPCQKVDYAGAYPD